MSKRCGNCEYSGYVLDCNTGKETLRCQETPNLEFEVREDEICQLHSFEDGYEEENKLHIIIGEKMPDDIPNVISSVAIYLKGKGNDLKLYADIDLPYFANYVESLDEEEKISYIFKEGYDSETEVSRYTCLVRPFGNTKGIYRLYVGSSPIKLYDIEPLCDEQTVEQALVYSMK